jgi:hypothetical protein
MLSNNILVNLRKEIFYASILKKKLGGKRLE